MAFAAALSRHPNSAAAVGEVAGELLDAVGPAPDLLAVFVSGKHGRVASSIVNALGRLLSPGHLVGASAPAVLANGREIEDGPAIAAWAGRFGPVHAAEVRDGALVAPPFTPTGLLLLADPGLNHGALLDQVHQRWPDLPLAGGPVAPNPATPARLMSGARVLTGGVVGAFLGPGLEVTAVVSQGFEPVGEPLVVTAADGGIVRSLGGRAAMHRLRELASDGLTADQIDMVNNGGLRLGVVVDEQRDQHGRGDFVIHDVLGANPGDSSIAVTAPVPVGTTVQFHVGDAETADDDLRAALSGHRAETALVFPGPGRGRALFSAADHDAALVEELFGRLPASGMFTAGPFGAVGGRPLALATGVSVVLLREVGGGG